MHDLQETMEWYRENNTTGEIGFDPDGMCQRVVRTARDIEPVYATAKKAQDATPKEHRFTRVRDLRKGMVVYFDDPNDSNTAGHVTTMIGRVKGFDEDSLHDVLVKTNSVKSGELVVVRGDYFEEHWGDKFQFGSDWVNGHVVEVFQRKPKQEPVAGTRQAFRESGPKWDVNILDKVGERLPEVKQRVDRIEATVAELPDDVKDDRVEKFKNRFEKNRVLDMPLLNALVSEKPQATRIKALRDELRAHIKAVLPR